MYHSKMAILFSGERNIRCRIAKESHSSIVIPNPWEALTECRFVETDLRGILHMALKTCLIQSKAIGYYISSFLIAKFITTASLL